MTGPTSLAALALLALLAGAPAAAAQTNPHAGMDMGGAAGSASDKAFGAANDRMMKSMGMKPSGNADRDFAAMMIPHHQGAIDMARIELQFGKDPTLRKLAEEIIAAQETEIAQLRKWLADHP